MDLTGRSRVQFRIFDRNQTESDASFFLFAVFVNLGPQKSPTVFSPKRLSHQWRRSKEITWCNMGMQNAAVINFQRHKVSNWVFQVQEPQTALCILCIPQRIKYFTFRIRWPASFCQTDERNVETEISDGKPRAQKLGTVTFYNANLIPRCTSIFPLTFKTFIISNYKSTKLYSAASALKPWKKKDKHLEIF